MAASKNWQPELHLENFLRARSALSGRLCVALSGGRDSVVLLHAAVHLGFGERLSALHVHHGLSPNADAWLDFCRRLCSGLGVALQIRQVTVERNGRQGLEAAAREARYAAFAQCDADCLLLAHHQADQAETVLFNLLRGSGIAGASGMPLERSLSGVRLLRPWLDVPAAEIAAFATSEGLQWIEDESNADPAFSRNFLRQEIFPAIQARFPAAHAALADAAGHFAEADALLAELAECDWQSACRGDSLFLPTARALSVPRLKNLLRWRLRKLGWRVPAAGRLEEFVRQLHSAAPDRHPALRLIDGEMVVRQRCLHWLPNCISESPAG